MVLFPSFSYELISVAVFVFQCCLEAGDGILPDACIPRFLSIGGAAYLAFDENPFTDDSIFTFFFNNLPINCFNMFMKFLT